MATTEVTVGVIKDASITAAKMAANSVDSASYVDGSIDPEHLADNAVTLAKMASGTDGNVISYDASGNPVAIATGSDGQVLTSAGAGAPPAFETPAGGGLILISRVAFTSNVTSVEFTSGFDGSLYDTYFVTYRVKLSADGMGFQLHFSTDGGSSYHSSGYLASYYYYNSSGGAGASVSETGYFTLNNNVGSATGELGVGHFTIYTPSATEYTYITGAWTEETNGGIIQNGIWGGQHSADMDVDAIKLSTGGGSNLNIGEVLLYGRVNS